MSRLDDPAEIEHWLKKRPPEAVVHQGNYRQVVALPTDEGGIARVVKVFEKPVRLAARMKRLLGWNPARHEWRTLSRLYDCQLGVPRPLEHGSLSDGRVFVVMQRAEGTPLIEALARGSAHRRATLVRLGESVAKLHEAGFVHGDLHLGNGLLSPSGEIVWLDFQRSRRSKSARARAKDIGHLDFSLHFHGGSIADRVRVRRAALGDRASEHSDAALRAVGLAYEKKRHDYFQNRNRHSLRPQGRFAPARAGRLRGLRVDDFPAVALARTLEIHFDEGAPSDRERLKEDRRALVSAICAGPYRVVVKQVLKGGWRRPLADVFRGSPGQRAWVAGHGLNARGIGAARPLAYLERRVCGLPVSSLVILEDQRPAQPAHLGPPGSLRVEPLFRLAVDLHRQGISHGDLQASHIFIDPEEPSRVRLIDLEAVRFSRRLSDQDRIQALAELNASIPEEQLADSERRKAFARYARLLPFSGDPTGPAREAAFREILRRGRERAHLWRGDGCSETTSSGR